MQAAEIRRPAARPTNDLTAYDLYLRGLQPLGLVRRRKASSRRSNLLEQAIDRDPHYWARRSAWAAHCHRLLDVERLE